MAKKQGATTPRQFRLQDETLDLLDRLASHYGGISRADVIRLAVRQLADSTLPSATEKKRAAPKSGD